jgi:hypothetical protein
VLQKYLHEFDMPPAAVQVGRQMVLSQLCRVKKDSMNRYAYGIFATDTNDSSSIGSGAGPGPDFLVFLQGGHLRNTQVKGFIRQDQTALRRYFGKAGIPTAAAAVLAAAGNISSGTAVSQTVLRVRNTELWQHLLRTTKQPGDYATKQQLLVTALQAAHLYQTDTMQYGVQHNVARLKHCSLFIAVAQVLGGIVPPREGRSHSTEQFISGESPTAQDEVLQLALKLFAACLANLAGATSANDITSHFGSSSSSSSSSHSIDDSYVQSVLQAYIVDDVVELIDALWLGARGIHPILVGLLPRLLYWSVNIQVCSTVVRSSHLGKQSLKSYPHSIVHTAATVLHGQSLR